MTAWIAPDEDNFDPLVPGQVLPAEMYPDDESARLDAERRLARPAWCRDKAMSRAQRTVLRCVAAGATIGEAAREAGVSYNVISHWRRNDASFQSYWDMAQDMSVEILVDTLVFCARRASVNPKYLPSLFKLLAARKPEMWGEKLDVTVTSGPMADNRQLAMMREMLAQMKAKELIGGDAAPQLEEGLPE